MKNIIIFILMLLHITSLMADVKVEIDGNETTVTIGEMKYRWHDEVIK